MPMSKSVAKKSRSSFASKLGAAHDAAMNASTRRSVLLVAYAGVQAIDFAGPAEVFAGATRMLGPDGGGYELTIASPDGQLDLGTQHNTVVRKSS